MFDLLVIRRSQADGGNDRLAVEKIEAAGIRDERARDIGCLGFALNAKQGIKVFAVETNLGAGEIFEVFSQDSGIQFLAFEKRAEICVTSLRSDLARSHPEIGTDDGVKPESKV